MAIIVVLAAVAIPTFGRQLETARETGDMELIRSAYTEALSMAVLDAADGKMDGKNGGTTLGGQITDAVALDDAAVPSETDTITATPISDADDLQYRYTVTLALMDDKAEIKQTGEGWQYVNSEIAGVAVPPVLTTQGEEAGTSAVAFNFEMQSDGNVRLIETESDNVGITVDVPTEE